jgi:hypothetical protein
MRACDNCGEPSDAVYVVNGYAGIYGYCENCFEERCSMKPTLDLYIGRYVAAIVRGDLPWQWAIRLDSGVEIRNKDRRETFSPDFEKFVGSRLRTISLSIRDTTITFSNGEKWSLNPTQYVIFDPKYDGEVYPQWPEELEDAGIPSHPDEDVSAKPSGSWYPEWLRLRQDQANRIQSQANEFLQEETNET